MSRLGARRRWAAKMVLSLPRSPSSQFLSRVYYLLLIKILIFPKTLIWFSDVSIAKTVNGGKRAQPSQPGKPSNQED